MPVATQPELLSPMLRRRLEISLPFEHRGSAVEGLCFMLGTMRNIPPLTCRPPPLDSVDTRRLARTFQYLAQPGLGAEQGPLSAEDCRTLQKVHYLYEVWTAGSLDGIATSGGRWPQSAVHGHLLHEVRREFNLLPYPKPREGWEAAIHDVAARLMVLALERDLQPTEVVVVASQEVPPAARRHLGGVKLHLAAWNAAAPPPECSAETADPNVWDPNNPLGNEPDLRRAPLQLDWTGITPLLPGPGRGRHSAGRPISFSSAGAG